MNKKIAVAIYDGLLGFEYGIVAELFGLVRPGLQATWYDYNPCRGESGDLTTNHGLLFKPKHGVKELLEADTIIVPGWRSADQKPKPAFLNALKKSLRKWCPYHLDLYWSFCFGVYGFA